MDVLIKAAALGIAGALVCLLLKKPAPEMGFLLGLGVSIFAAALGGELLKEVVELVELARAETNLRPAVVTPVLKCVVIGLVTRLSMDICRDAGQGAIASAVELCGTACALTAALPLVRSLLAMMGELL